MSVVAIIGIDLAKRAFQAHGACSNGSVAFRKKLSRAQLLAFLAKQPRCELCWIFGDGVNQAADFFSDATSIPSRNVTPLMTFGN